MFETCPKMKNAYAQRYADKGFRAAKAGKPLDAMDDKADPDYEDTTWQPAARFAWLRGWEGGGGDIHQRVVVTERERLVKRRAELVALIEHTDRRLDEISQLAHKAGERL